MNCKRMMPLERRNEPQMLRQFSKMYPSYNPLLRRRHQQLVEAQAFNQWLSDRRLRQEGETYADELSRTTEAVNRRIPQLRYAPAEHAGVHRMAREVDAGRNTSDSQVYGVLCDISFSVKMEERRSNGFRVKPSFGQVLGYIQEGEPLTLDLPNRKASIYTSSHFYLDDYPNAPEPLSDAPLPHTSINPAAAFETADEGYDGVPFPRPPREFTRPSFLPDSDDGGTDPGQALRNDGLNPPRPPTLGGRMRESGIQAAEAIVAGGAAGAAAAVRSVSENQTMLALRGGGDWLDRTLRMPRRPPGLAPPPDEVPAPQIIGRPSEVEPLLQRAGQRAAEVERAGH